MGLKYLGILLLPYACYGTGPFEGVENKAFIMDCKQKIDAVAPDQKAELMLKLSKAYLHDQDAEKAILSFLQALDWIIPHKISEISPEEQNLYQEAFKIYLDRAGASSPQEIAFKMLAATKPQLDAHPDFTLLRLLQAIAFANVGMFDDFFDSFYTAYHYHPDHYLVYKTKAILFIRLHERARIDQDRESWRKSALANLQEALERYPGDTSLYRLLLIFTPEEGKAKAIETWLQKIIESDLMISRSDVGFFVEQAVKEKKIALAQRLIDKSRRWYSYSRAINDAQEYLDKSKNLCKGQSNHMGVLLFTE